MKRSKKTDCEHRGSRVYSILREEAAETSDEKSSARNIE